MIWDTLLRLAVALGLGLLIGLQREAADPQKMAGIRTFPLIALTGALAMLAGDGSVWLAAAGFLAVAGMLAVANVLAAKTDDDPDTGLTTEVAALLVYVLAAYLMEGSLAIGVVVGGAAVVLLHLKAALHGWVRRLEPRDLRAVMQLVLIALVILPVLPDEPYGPFQVLNPRKIWLMVVLIVGIGLFGYLLYRLLSPKTGTVLGGLLGGVISSTATTVSSSRATKNQPGGATPAALVIMIATVVSICRIIVEIVAVAPGHFLEMMFPFAAFLGVVAVITAVLYFLRSGEIAETSAPEDPALLKPALVFAALYALVLLGVAAGRHHFGDSGMYVIAVISGLTDVDAITLSTSHLVSQGNLPADTGWRVIMVGAVSNTLFKGGIVALLGSRALLARIAVLYGIAVIAGVLLVVLWP